MKFCKKCNNSKSLDEFHKNKNRPDGLSSNCKSCAINIAKKWNEINKNRVSSYQKEIRRYARHGITKEKYLEILESQDSSCAICKRKNVEFVIDHNHKCCNKAFSCGLCIRGLLCNICNSFLSKVEKDSHILANISKYLDYS